MQEKNDNIFPLMPRKDEWGCDIDLISPPHFNKTFSKTFSIRIHYYRNTDLKIII